MTPQVQPSEHSASSWAHWDWAHAAHEVVMPSQVTCPGWPAAQLRSTAEQLVVLLLPLQLMVPDPQFTEALQRAFPRTGRLAAGTRAGVVARVARKA
jgi:hypothetical protein